MSAESSNPALLASALAKNILLNSPFEYSEKVKYSETHVRGNQRFAAVAVIIRVFDQSGLFSVDKISSIDRCQLLLIKRAKREGDPWSGDIALPGGHVELEEDDFQAVCRETQEEIGLDLRYIFLQHIICWANTSSVGLIQFIVS
jgi:8-oxo-dGTP pyrophosphatase MutT (NUDIX family)